MKFQAMAVQAGATLMLTAVAASAQAASLCVFDIVGTSGDAYNMAKDYAVGAQKFGVTLELKAFKDEAQATEEFRAGKCDGLMATAFRTRQFNGVAASIDTFGSTTVVKGGKADMAATFEVVRKVVATFSSAGAAKLMTDDHAATLTSLCDEIGPKMQGTVLKSYKVSKWAEIPDAEYAGIVHRLNLTKKERAAS